MSHLDDATDLVIPSLMRLVVPLSQCNGFWDSIFDKVGCHFILRTHVQNNAINNILKCIFLPRWTREKRTINLLSCTNSTKSISWFFFLSLEFLPPLKVGNPPKICRWCPCRLTSEPFLSRRVRPSSPATAPQNAIATCPRDLSVRTYSVPRMRSAPRRTGRSGASSE